MDREPPKRPSETELSEPARKSEAAVESLIAGGVLLGAMAIRLLLWTGWRESPFSRQPLLDAAFYHDLATGAFHPPSGPLLWNPFTPVFLKTVYGIFGVHPTAVLFVQMGLGAVGAEVAYLSARRWMRSRAIALVCGVLAALYAPFLFFEGLLLGAAPAVFLVWMFLGFSSLAETRPARWSWLPAGMALGAAGLARPTLLVAVPLLVPWLAWRSRKSEGAHRALPPALLLLGVFLPLLPSFIHNLRYGVAQPVALHGGVNFYIGNRQGAGGGYERPFPGPHGLWGQRRTAKEEAERRAGRHLDWAEADRFWYREGFREALGDPVKWAALLGRKVLLLLNAYEIPLNYNYAFIRSRTPHFSLPFPGFGLLLPLAAAGAGFLGMKRRLPWPAILLFIGAATGTVLFFVTSRYRIPLAPPLILLAGAGIVEGVRALISVRPAAFTLAAALAAAAAVPVLAPVPRSDTSGAWRLYGDALRKDGRLSEAMNAYENSIAIRPSSAAWNNRGTALLKLRGREGAAKAARMFRAAKALDPGNREAWNNLGVALKKSGDPLGAEDVFEQTIQRFPWYEKPVENLARLYQEQGDPAAARALIDNLARLLEEKGKVRKAQALRKRWRGRGR
ncbi:MAG: tetratricopeptide repeat protein [Planctomycetota bacterium]